MSPTHALLQLQPGYVMPVRVFINRREVLNNAASCSLFEAPILSNSAIVRLKSPSVRVHLSEDDKQSLLAELRDDLLYIIYELGSPGAEETLRKFKIGGLADFRDIVRAAEQGDRPEQPIPGLDLHTMTFERLDKQRFRLHFEHNWVVNIILNDIRKLAVWRRLLLCDIAPIGVPAAAAPAPMPAGAPYVLLRERRGRVSPQGMLQEDAPEGVPREGDLNVEQKPVLDYRYKSVTNLGPGIEIHVLQRPRRVRPR
ncbi:ADR352Cp [Eremothecium gossypii ATCC 10895]|uniref:ADR352Cp n=1 Tax=Eremothecium gossypii (strain ATCC 10895 / CBS 109.51 / FGSC 9923 / NRRL Y-1056) TaxID=284811 RepID=Q759C5_EREGS|nr:ADR352Cp [Eremothecium gossypii ATCC 10895]AAS52272.2 ADR352Cp [Eremothecium gossypii ATCC 10895]AEY96570.1 FADR352Cp [Eremothecium gossypii FDAG1]